MGILNEVEEERLPKDEQDRLYTRFIADLEKAYQKAGLVGLCHAIELSAAFVGGRSILGFMMLHEKIIREIVKEAEAEQPEGMLFERKRIMH